MQFALFSNGQRRNQVAKHSYDDDLQEIILADQLGIQEAWISEHGVFVTFHAPDQLPSADPFICKAAALTKQIRMGPGIRALPYFHPLQVATDVAVCDHLTDGRYMAGFGLGIGDGGGTRGKLPAPQRTMMREAVEIILKAWTSPEPFDWDGEVWQGKNWKIIPKPLTKPVPDVGIACARTDTTLELAAQKGFFPLLSWTSPPQQLAGMVKTYLDTAGDGVAPSRNRVRVARFIYVADSVAEARRDLRNTDLGPIHAGRRLDGYIPQGKTREDVTLDYLIDTGAFIVGDPERVYRQLREFYDSIGGFGVLMLVVGKDWATNQQRATSMRRFMQEVAPRLVMLNPAPVRRQSLGGHIMARHIPGPLYFNLHGSSGMPMIFLHSTPDDHRLWMYQTARFSSWFRTIAVDLAGYGRSGPAQQGLSVDRSGRRRVGRGRPGDVGRCHRARQFDGQHDGDADGEPPGRSACRRSSCRARATCRRATR